ncbi:cytochrome b [Aquabacterium sp. CECT 9606]|uniref:cytochrome b n=1 Tax=Aquabacterium sp. CECT 9606 TaxID=2845822 RepID=UPI001E5B7813|nr:cytochrome b/b6 domain-containing protein [Aquabacterium sp. CECT 9606]CAH0356208.1 Cytochrome b561 [Aquabacterium sp. CECT 9606]
MSSAPIHPSPFAIRQPWPTVALHWFTVIALMVSMAAVWGREALDDKSQRAALLTIHQQLGLAIWLALAARLLVRAWLGRVNVQTGASWHLRAAAVLAHWSLYAALFVQPLFGWIMTNAHGHQVRLLGWIPLPQITEADPDLADMWADRHAAMAWVLGGLITLHIAAALWHHFILRDGVLRSIMPARR